MKSTYLVTLYSNVLYTLGEYQALANSLRDDLDAMFTDPEMMSVITKGADMETCSCEADIVQDEDGMKCKCVFDFEAPTRVQFDKAKLSVMLKEKEYNWKVEKRAVHGA